jgi:phenylalanyl-tRNA synthetase beta chain
MRVKLEWLNELVDLKGITIEEIVRTLSLYSIEVENVEKVVGGTNLAVGLVLTRIAHPDSDHLSVCTVDVGNEVLQIVCGAPNVREGQYVIVAKNGAELPGGLKIKRSKIRGVESNGMICSLAEIGMDKKFIPDEYQNGIYYFKNTPELGSDALQALNLDDTVIELGVTPNRGDLLSMIGVAYEASAVFNRPMTKLSYEIFSSGRKSADAISIKGETDGCQAYYAQVFENVMIKPSPWWLISRLIAFGIRPINNVVDITNYIMALFGQPLHAFDYNRLGKKIVVRNAFKDENIRTLDNEVRKLETTDIVITDGTKPVAIAGVMGGADTQITESTKNIVIEAAVFSPASVRQTALRLGLRSDASARFEKGVDINRTKQALEYTAYLLKTLADATVLPEPSFFGMKEMKPEEISITAEEVKKLLGIGITEKEISAIMNRLGFAMKGSTVIVPSRRNDIRIKEDLIEEIGRIHGYDNLPLTLPKSSLAGSLSSVQKIRRQIRNTLIGLGLSEIITYSLVDERSNETFIYNHTEGSTPFELLMPMNNDRRYLRKSLAMSAIENVKYCYSRKIRDIAAFEIGKAYYKKDGYQEEEFLSVTLANQYSETLWQGKSEKADFYVLKGILGVLFAKLGLKADFKPIDREVKELHPKRSASIIVNGENIGFAGCIHPQFASENNLDEVYIAEIRLNPIYGRPLTELKYVEISKVPSVERDLAIVVNRDVLAGDIVDVIRETESKTLSDVKVFDIYTGEKVESHQKSVAVKLVFTSLDTLTDDIVNTKVHKIIKALTAKFNAVLRN